MPIPELNKKAEIDGKKKKIKNEYFYKVKKNIYWTTLIKNP